MCMKVLTAFMYVSCVCLASMEVRRGWYILGTELRTVVNSQVGAGNWPQVLCKSNKYSSPLAISTDQICAFLILSTMSCNCLYVETLLFIIFKKIFMFFFKV